MAEQVQLKLAKKTDEGFFGKALSNIGKAVYSSGTGLYTLLISTKRSSVLKHFASYRGLPEVSDEKKRKNITEKYEKVYENYLNVLEKYITENIYTKMQKKASNLEEEKIMSSYYECVALKGIDHVEYKNRLHMLLLNMEWQTISSTKSGKFLEKYKEFYLQQMEELYRASMRHAAVLLANAKEGDKDKFDRVYQIIEDYIKFILPLLEETPERKQILEDYKKHILGVDTFSKKEYIPLQKRLCLLNLSRKIFEYSLPTVAAEQCYIELINSARITLSNTYVEADKFEVYQVLLDALEEYHDNILARKSYWNSVQEEEELKRINEKWTELKKLARIDYDDFKKQREVLFVKKDLSDMKNKKWKIEEVRRYYRDRMLQLNALRRIPNHYKLNAGVWRTRRRQKADEDIIAENEQNESESVIEKIEANSNENMVAENVQNESESVIEKIETNSNENMVAENVQNESENAHE